MAKPIQRGNLGVCLEDNRATFAAISANRATLGNEFFATPSYYAISAFSCGELHYDAIDKHNENLGAGLYGNVGFVGFVKGDYTIHQCEESIIRTAPYIFGRVPFGPSLSNEDAAGPYNLTGSNLDA